MFPRAKRRQMYGGRWLLALTMAGAMAGGRTFAQGPNAIALLESVFKDWQHRQSVLKSARYVLEGTNEYKDAQLPAGNPIRPYRIVFLLDLVKKRYRLESSEDVPYSNGKYDPKEWEWRTWVHTHAYDGEVLQHYSHRKANRIEKSREDDLAISKGKLGPLAFFGSEEEPIFFAHGIVWDTNSPLMVDKWPLTHDPDDLVVAGQQLLGGQNCLLVRTEPYPTGGAGAAPGEGFVFSQFWINPAQKGAIHRLVCFSGSKPSRRLDISWKNTAHGWWADHWSNTNYDYKGQVLRIQRFRVESFEANPQISDGDFKLPAEPGMVVEVGENPPPGKGLDPFQAAVTRYRVSPSGAWEEISAKGFTTLEGKELPPEGHRRWIVWTLGVGVSLAVLFFYVLRRRRKRAAL